MLIPFTRVETDLVNGYMASREPIARFTNFEVYDKDGETIDLRDAAGNDTFKGVKEYNGVKESEIITGFFLDETPFEATMVVVGLQPYGKGRLLLHEVGTDRFHLMYPSHLVKVLKQAHILNGAFAGTFQYTRKSNVFCIKFLGR